MDLAGTTVIGKNVAQSRKTTRPNENQDITELSAIPSAIGAEASGRYVLKSTCARTPLIGLRVVSKRRRRQIRSSCLLHLLPTREKSDQPFLEGSQSVAPSRNGVANASAGSGAIRAATSMLKRSRITLPLFYSSRNRSTPGRTSRYSTVLKLPVLVQLSRFRRLPSATRETITSAHRP